MTLLTFIRIAIPVFLLTLTATACAPYAQPVGPERLIPQLEAEAIISYDGRSLPLRKWPAVGPEKAIILALHGFNDYARAWELPAAYWASYGVTTYAYDQRGFGHDPNAGIWGDDLALLRDVQITTRLLRDQYPRLPIFLVGESMGGAIALSTMAVDPLPVVDGLILSAPAVWGSEALPLLYRASSWITAHTFPSVTVTGRNLGIRASDNIAMLRELGRDPLFIKATRFDAIWSLVGMMGQGLRAAEKITLPTLVLYGMHDQVIPKAPIDAMLSRMAHQPRVALYDNGWHMLFRDLQGPIVWQDVLEWMFNPDQPLPSGAETLRRPLFPKK